MGSLPCQRGYVTRLSALTGTQSSRGDGDQCAPEHKHGVCSRPEGPTGNRGGERDRVPKRAWCSAGYGSTRGLVGLKVQRLFKDRLLEVDESLEMLTGDSSSAFCPTTSPGLFHRGQPHSLRESPRMGRTLLAWLFLCVRGSQCVLLSPLGLLSAPCLPKPTPLTAANRITGQSQRAFLLLC